jgi:uncharacterized protein YdiU (UPF0061 family)
MRQANPAIIPRNHQIEAVIKAAVENDDFEPFHRLHAALADPLSGNPDLSEYARPPQAPERVVETFCGT